MAPCKDPNPGSEFSEVCVLDAFTVPSNERFGASVGLFHHFGGFESLIMVGEDQTKPFLTPIFLNATNHAFICGV